MLSKFPPSDQNHIVIQKLGLRWLKFELMQIWQLSPTRKGYKMVRLLSRIFKLLLTAAFTLDSLALQMAQAAEQTGQVKSGNLPVAHATVTLYWAGIGRFLPPTVLGSTKSNAEGFFHIPFTPPPAEEAVLYLIADGPPEKRKYPWAPSQKSSIRLATVLGTHPFSPEVVINERTTVATAYAMAQFLKRGSISGKSPGLQNAAETARNLVDLATGEVGAVLGNSINGTSTTTMAEFNSLANLLAACVQDQTECPRLFRETETPSGIAPRNTFQAIENIAHFPWHNVRKLFIQSLQSSIYHPALTSSQTPDAWTLAIRYSIFSDPPESLPLLDGPGNIAFDSKGHAWVNNNFFNSPLPSEVCGDDRVYKFQPDGQPSVGSPFGGNKGNGGLYGAGFGITVDKFGKVWVANFGFQASQCHIDSQTQDLLSRSLSQFNPNGEAVSPSRPPEVFGGWRSPQANFSRPQGMATDQDENVWTVNCGNDTVTKLTRGKLEDAENFSNIGLDNPFSISIDQKGIVWVTSNHNSSVIRLAPSGVPIGNPITDTKINRPMGIAHDSRGNAWVANAAIISPPCGTSNGAPDPRGEFANLEEAPDGASVTLIRSPHRLESFTGGGVWWPWGIAVDGNDNVWVVNFGGPMSGLIGITHLCGTKAWTCPLGHKTGDPISPPTGYTSDAFARLTGIAIDQSGNVWAANNFIRDAFRNPQNPGGHELVVLIGAAAPVKTPLIGPPQKP